MALGPAELVGLSHKGRIEVGADADFAEWNLDIVETIDPTTLLHRHPITPYAGSTLRGRVQRTWLRGSLIYDNGVFPGAPSGALLKRTS
jgi:allantoinase